VVISWIAGLVITLIGCIFSNLTSKFEEAIGANAVTYLIIDVVIVV
jgi:hypothetical protein